MKTGNLTSLSEQNVLDCSRNDGNKGCKGGDMVASFKYIHSNDGLDAEISYPYTGKQGECRYSLANNVTSLKAYGVIREGKMYIFISEFSGAESSVLRRRIPRP